MRYAFFDIDGTLSVPVFVNKEGIPGLGFPASEWPKFVKEHRNHSYDNCMVLPAMREYLAFLKDHDVECIILSASSDKAEDDAKIAFCRKRFPGIFSEYLFVKHAAEKPTRILEYAHQHGARPSDCMIVEDMYETILTAKALDIQGVHISHIAAGCADIVCPIT